jgi:hypothetical protein
MKGLATCLRRAVDYSVIPIGLVGVGADRAGMIYAPQRAIAKPLGKIVEILSQGSNARREAETGPLVTLTGLRSGVADRRRRNELLGSPAAPSAAVNAKP